MHTPNALKQSLRHLRPETAEAMSKLVGHQHWLVLIHDMISSAAGNKVNYCASSAPLNFRFQGDIGYKISIPVLKTGFGSPKTLVNIELCIKRQKCLFCVFSIVFTNIQGNFFNSPSWICQLLAGKYVTDLKKMLRVPDCPPPKKKIETV